MDWNFGPEEQVLWPASVLAGVVMSAAMLESRSRRSPVPTSTSRSPMTRTRSSWRFPGRSLALSIVVDVCASLLKVYDITRKVSSSCFKCYDGLSPMQKVEWNNRGFSTVHALVAAAVSFYLVMISGLFSEDVNGIIIDRKSWLSDSMFGVSIGYFLADLAMILWYFPSLGGKEFLLHHGLSMYAIGLALFSGKAHMYILMVLFTEATTPFVNLRWYLDVTGQKTHSMYLYNGLALFVGWLVARIILFVYFFSHMYFHFDQVKSIFTLGFYSIMTVPPTLAVMNVFWFWKISRGMIKTLCKKKQHTGNGKTD